jgi:hypothetical protein
MRIHRRAWLAALVLVAALGGCTSFRGVEEFNAYNEAFRSARGAGGSVLDRLGVAERRLWRYCTNYLELIPTSAEQSAFYADECRRFDPVGTPFQVADAPYVATTVDPPSTAAFRRALRAVGAYNEALHRLASGQTAEAVAGDVVELAGVATAAGAATVPSGAALGAALRTINADVAAFKAPLAGGLGFVTRAEFRDRLVEQADTMRAAMTGVRDATPAMFNVLRAAEIVAAPAGGMPDPDAIAEARRMIANWVLMLDAARRSLDAAVVAVAEPGAAGVSDLLATSRELNIVARDLRRVLAGEIR